MHVIQPDELLAIFIIINMSMTYIIYLRINYRHQIFTLSNTDTLYLNIPNDWYKLHYDKTCLLIIQEILQYNRTLLFQFDMHMGVTLVT